MVNRQAVGAHYGLLDWLMQRITGAVIGLYVIGLLVVLFANPGLDLAGWQQIFNRTSIRLVTFVTLISIFIHAWVGMRDIIMDYIRATSIRLALEIVVALALVVYTGWAIQILWGSR